MPTPLMPQAWGVRGASVTLAAADAAGNTAQNAGRGTVLVASNAGAGALRVRLVSAVACRFKRLDHYFEESIPNDSARHVIHVGGVAPGYSDQRRFGERMAIEYPDGVADLEIAVAQMGSLYGVGNDTETPPALGSTPADVPVVDDSPTDFTQAVVSGMRLKRNAADVTCWIKNQGPGTRTVYFHAAALCDYGFQDDEPLVLPPGTERTHFKFLSVARFGADVAITYDDPTGLEFAAVRMEAI